MTTNLMIQALLTYLQYMSYCLDICFCFFIIYVTLKVVIKKYHQKGLWVESEGNQYDAFGNVVSTRSYIKYNNKRYYVNLIHKDEGLKIQYDNNQPYVVIDNKRVDIII